MLTKIKSFLLNHVYYRINNVNGVDNTSAKRALLSYSVLHFRKGSKKFIHPNTIESKLILRVLTEKGYRVDVYNNTYAGHIDFSDYDLIFGEGMPLYTYMRGTCQKKCRVVYYATGSHPFYQTEKSVQALVRFKRTTKLAPIDSLRIIPLEWGIAASLADRCVVIGNEVTCKTFVDQGHSDVVSISPPFFLCNPVRAQYSDSRKRSFLWFGSFGYLHKGLDIVLDFFRENADLDLYICGYSDRERAFWDSYAAHSVIPANIHDCGFVDVRSGKFSGLLEQCGSAILLSASEGCSTALLTVIGNGGLIPIASRSCGIDIDTFGFSVKEHTTSDLQTSVTEYLETDVSRLSEMSEVGREYVNANYTEDGFYRKLSVSLD